MTTGRINQVTILTPAGASGDDNPGLNSRGSSSSYRKERGRIQARPRGHRPPRRGGPRDHLFAPTEVSQVWSTAGERAARGGCDVAAICTPRVEDTPTRVTSDQRSDGYRAGLTPENLRKTFSHRPIIHRPQHARAAEPLGVRLSRTVRPRATDVAAQGARCGHEPSAAAGACSGRSAPGTRTRK